MIKIGILFSGGGSTMAHIVRECQSGSLQGLVEPTVVISSRENAGGLQRAKEAALANIYILDPDSREKFASREEWARRLINALNRHNVDWICQYEWMPLTPKALLEAFPNRMINQHPGPVPEFGGKGMFGRRVHCARLLFARRVKRDFYTMVIAQRVGPQFDEGQVLHAENVMIHNDDDVDALTKRALPVEQRVQVETLHMIADGRITDDTPGNTHAHYRFAQTGEERHILHECKRYAKLLYPKG